MGAAQPFSCSAENPGRPVHLLPSPRLARPFLATDRAWQSIKDPFPLLELAQLLATFQGVQTSMEKVTTAHTADRKEDTWPSPTLGGGAGRIWHDWPEVKRLSAT